MIQVNNKELKAQFNAAQALQSHAVIHSCISTIERELKKMGVEDNITWGDTPQNLSFSIGEGDRLTTYVYNQNIDYDAIMDNKHTAIGNTKTISCHYIQKQVLVDYGIELWIHFNFSCDLPEEDLMTLRMLGKIHVSHDTYSSTSESVFCTK